jgi:TRAP-type C4-dicarboxylate transport system permease small subunit
MRGVLSAYRSTLRLLGLIEVTIGVVLLATIVLSITTNIILRSGFRSPIVWVEELATFAFIWGTFIGAAAGLKFDRHIKIETFVGYLSLRGQAVLKAIVYAGMMLLSLQLLPLATKVMAIESRSMVSSFAIPTPRHLVFSVPLYVGFLSIAVTCLYLVLEQLRIALGGEALPPIFAKRPPETDSHAQAEEDRILREVKTS